MKKTIALSLLLLALAAPVWTINAQTNEPPAAVSTNLPPTLPDYLSTWLEFLSATSTNWIVAPYFIYVDDEVDKMGGGVAALYSLSEYAMTGLRFDFIDGQAWMPSVNVQLQLPLRLANKVVVSPFAVSGLATPLGNDLDQGGEAVGILGAGIAVRIGKNFGAFYDAEAWSRFDGLQHRFGVYWKF